MFPGHQGAIIDAMKASALSILVEQVSKDGGATWTDRLCLLLEGISGEVCYTRDQTP